MNDETSQNRAISPFEIRSDILRPDIRKPTADTIKIPDVNETQYESKQLKSGDESPPFDAPTEGQETHSVINMHGRTSSSFVSMFREFNYDEIREAEDSGDGVRIWKAWKKLQNQMWEFLVEPPEVPINASCKAPDLPAHDLIDCSQYPAFSGRRPGPAKVAHAFELGFDSDMLEILLNELDPAVDYFFMIEWTRVGDRLVPMRLKQYVFNVKTSFVFL